MDKPPNPIPSQIRSLVSNAGSGPFLLLGELPPESHLGESQRRWMGIAAMLNDYDSVDASENAPLWNAKNVAAIRCRHVAAMLGLVIGAVDEADLALEELNVLLKAQRGPAGEGEEG